MYRVDGKVLQIVGPETAKLRGPYATVLVLVECESIEYIRIY